MANIKCNGKINTKSIEIEESFSALNNIGGGFAISDPLNVGIELGRRDGTPGTPYLDFHTDGSPVTDYNSRIIAESNYVNVISNGGLKINTKDVVAIESQSLGSNGYVKYSNGLIIQWGSLVTILANMNKTTLPIAFSNTNYVVCANTSGITKETNLYAIACTPVSTTQFYALANFTAQSSAAKYIAIGY